MNMLEFNTIGLDKHVKDGKQLSLPNLDGQTKPRSPFSSTGMS